MKQIILLLLLIKSSWTTNIGFSYHTNQESSLVAFINDNHNGVNSRDHQIVYLKSNSQNGNFSLNKDSSLLNNNKSRSYYSSLEKMKSSNNKTKKNRYPPLIIQNIQENQLNDDILSDFNKFGAYSKLVSQLLNSIVNKELGSSSMQQKLDKAKKEISILNLEIIIDNIAEKMIQKIKDVHSTIELTGEVVQEIFRKHLVSNLSTNSFGCCDLYDQKYSLNEFKINEFLESYNSNSEYDAKLLNEIKNENYHFDKRFNSWISESFSCDISDSDFHRSHFFNPAGPNLTRHFRINLAKNPRIKWQYFTSFLGIHTEYPSYFPPNDYCFLNLINKYLANKSKSSLENEKMVFKSLHKFKKKKGYNWFYHRKAYMDFKQSFIQRHRENLFATALPHNKLVIIVIDRGSALTEHQLTIAKSVAKYILNSLSHRDKVGILDLSSTVHYSSSESCSSNLDLAYANYETKHFYGKYINELERSHNSTHHYLGFKKVFEIISANYLSFKDEIGSEPEIFIAYISRGLLASLADAKPVMQLISNELKNCSYSFIINTYALIDERIPIMLEAIFLREIAAMNFKKFNVSPPPSHKIKPGLMVALNSTENLSYTLNGIYTVLTKSVYESYSNLYISLPHFDFLSKDTHVSISKAFHYRDRLIGVVGVDLSFFDFATDIIYYDHQDSYAFLMDAYSGKLLYHPIFAQYFRINFKQRQNSKFNIYWNHDPYLQNSFINVEHVEPIEEFGPLIKKMIMTKSSGMHSIKLNNRHMFNNETNSNWRSYQWYHLLNRYVTVVYHWRRILSSPYIVVIATYHVEKKQEIPLNDEIYFIKHHLAFQYQIQKNEFFSHRLDYHFNNKHLKLCKHFNQLATIETATLYLSSNAFLDHYKFEIDGNSHETVKRYMAYFTDKTNTIPNPGLVEDVRSDVNLLNFLIDFWKNSFETSETSKYIVRKYIATASGAFLLYPGSLLDSSFYPKTRLWYSRAVSNPGKIIFIPPYIDIGGGGYIVTISQAIYKGNAGRIHSEKDIWAVMGIDLTLGYFHKIIDTMGTICPRNNASCFLMDDYGYLIVHSSFSKPSLMPFIERQHITHKEPHMMNHLLNHQNFVQKLICNSYTDRTMQRYYMFNTSLSGIITNVFKNENSSCAKYIIASLEETNVFFGMVDHTCDNFTTFCPCSLTDHLCLNCHRMEQTDCECPCECPLIMNLCNGQLTETEDKHPICNAPFWFSQKFKEPNVPKHLFDSLNTCIENECSNKYSESECKGILGCEWCSMENGVLLAKPFCTIQDVCFGGIYGSKNPYITNLYYRHENYKKFQNAPIGPLTTTLIICFIILTFSVYCFHFQTNRNFGTRYLSSMHNDHQILQPSNDVMDINENEYYNDQNLEAVASFVQEPVNHNYRNIISPYQYNSNYRRRTETESDFGYSTMTPNDDSELNGPIYINPYVIRSNKMKVLENYQDSGSSIGSITSNELESSSIISSPPSELRTTKNFSKQKFIDYKSNKVLSEKLLKHNQKLPTLDERFVDDISTIHVNS